MLINETFTFRLRASATENGTRGKLMAQKPVTESFDCTTYTAATVGEKLGAVVGMPVGASVGA